MNRLFLENFFTNTIQLPQFCCVTHEPIDILASLAIIFMYTLEDKYLNESPSSFKPVLYRRYVYDTFCLFKNFTMRTTTVVMTLVGRWSSSFKK